MSLRFIHPASLVLLALLPGVAALSMWADARRRGALQRFSLAPSSVDFSTRKRKRGALLAALALLIVALARPVWIGNPEAPPPHNADAVFLLDVSRSMLADDAKPTRLDRAKAIIGGMMNRFHTERAALVAFAGNCAVQCPLTIDYDYFRERLDTADTDSVTRGGTRIGEAVVFALRTAFDDVRRGHKVLVVLSDGGDQDNALPAAAQLAGERNVRIVAVGIGDDRSGAIVPRSASDRSPFLYHGNPVTTRLESAALEALARTAPGGQYLRAGTQPLDAGQMYRQYVSPDSPLAGGLPRIETDIYPALLALAVALLALELRISDRKVLSAMALFFLLAAPGRSQDEDPIAAGNRLFRSGHFTSALHYYQTAANRSPNSPQVLFNLALTQYRTEEYAEAAATYRRAASQSRDTKFRAQCKFGEANAAYRVAMHRSGELFEFQQALSLVIPVYRDALALDPSLTDCKYNIEVIKRRLRNLAGPLSAASARYLPQQRAGSRRAATEAREILDENRDGKKTKGQVGRPSIDTDW